jgi:hypothetical protein
MVRLVSSVQWHIPDLVLEVVSKILGGQAEVVFCSVTWYPLEGGAHPANESAARYL